MKYRILVVDDEQEVLGRIQTYFGEMYDLVLVSDPNEALNLVHLTEPDLVILDVMMPEKNGHQLAGWIQSHSSFFNVPIIMLDDPKRPDIQRAIYESEGMRYLDKPLSMKELSRKILSILEAEVRVPSNKLFPIERVYEIRNVKYTASVPMPMKPKKSQEPAVAEPIKKPEPAQMQPKPNSPTTEAVKHPKNLSAVAPETLASFHGRILVVDDDIDLLQLLRVIFSTEYEYITATDGFAGVKKALLYLPDILILDIMMTKMNGFQVCEMVRKQPQLKKIPVVFLSAKSHPSDIERAKKLGGTEYITKPFDPALLKETVVKLLKQYGIHPPGRRMGYSEVLRHEGVATPQEKK